MEAPTPIIDPNSTACRAFSIDLIIRKILSLLDTPILFYNCRLVNQKFHKEATSILISKRGPFWLKKFKWNEKKFTQLHSLAVNSKDFPFTRLNLCREAWTDVPCNDLDLAGAESFFQSCGHIFQHLRLNNFMCSSSQFAKLFCSYLPSIEILELGRVSVIRGLKHRSHVGAIADFGKTLPDLRRIKIQGAQQYGDDDAWNGLQHLLRAAINLEAIEGDIMLTTRGLMHVVGDTNTWNRMSSIEMTEIAGEPGSEVMRPYKSIFPLLDGPRRVKISWHFGCQAGRGHTIRNDVIS